MERAAWDYNAQHAPNYPTTHGHSDMLTLGRQKPLLLTKLWFPGCIQSFCRHVLVEQFLTITIPSALIMSVGTSAPA